MYQVSIKSFLIIFLSLFSFALNAKDYRPGIDYQFLDRMDSKRSFRISKFSGLIYFGNDTIAYYSINKKLINKFIKLNKPVFIINLS